MHQQLHEGALVPPTDGVLHGFELGCVHIDAARQLLDSVLLTQAVHVFVTRGGGGAGRADGGSGGEQQWMRA